MRLFLYLSMLVLFCACSNSEMAMPEYTSEDDESVAFSKMISVSAAGEEVTLGTNSNNARTNERPAMQVKFSYDFSMSRSEVTCGEFNRLMKKSFGLSLNCHGYYPATDVTYYDAVLFANERSKREGRDTAYSYSKATFDKNHHCTNLEGFFFSTESEGYRLPTEAEWLLVAGRNWSFDKGWTAENSKLKIQTVCGKAKKDEFCDLLGNVIEWVNDWFGNLKDTTLLNYVGAPDGGALGQRVIKGGCYRNANSFITLYNRGDIYTVVSSTRAEYVGFRLAKGAIPEPTWMGGDGKAATSRVVPLASSSALHSLTGTHKMKLAFRNDITGNLAYIDYSSGVPSVVEIEDTLDVYHPEISPDGNRVAFCSRIEGVSGKSALYVRDLNAEGTNLVKLEVESAVIPRWQVLENGTTIIIYVTDAGNNKDETSFKETSTWQVKFANGKFGKPTKILDGAYHGGISEDKSLAVTGARLLRARVAKPGSTVFKEASDLVWYDSAQACNVSLSKDRSKRTLFLDFGAGPGRKFVGESYGMHERLFVADSTGKLIQSVAAPAGYSFDHTEWGQGGENLVVASLSNLDGAHKKIVLVDMSDSSVVELVEGDELWHPSFWVKGKSDADRDVLLDLDSAGMYFDYNPANLLQGSSVELAMRMQMFWKNYRNIECVTLGSSMLLDAVIDTSITAFKTLNMGVTLADLFLFKYIASRYILRYAEKIKVLVVELSPGFLFRQENDYFYYVRLFSPGLIYDEHHLSHETKDVVAALSQEYSYPRSLFAQNYMDDSFLLPSVSWGDTYVDADVSKMPYNSVKLRRNREMLDSLRAETERRGVKLILAITPQNPDFAKTESFGSFGPKMEVAKKIVSALEKSGYYIFDENKFGEHDYSSEMAYNSNHLSYLGARQFTARLDSLLKTLR